VSWRLPTRHGAKATLADLEVGDEVYAVSRLEGDKATARRIFSPKQKSG